MRLKVENLGEVSKIKRPGVHSKKKNSLLRLVRIMLKDTRDKGDERLVFKYYIPLAT